ncbi:hypothetical protein SLEP1_g34870 [Rubroshorea leprosula]|uniref:Uncharacterized protein n=1 Tax=Rubroshorea leprosula TaxID=152421 RepID=A0AAV5KLC6_9ROSI|nr:hypothetical protein SLEP1_g34870 [Rubroshorea leprosula]
MDGRGEEYDEEQFAFTLKRKVRSRKLEFVGWGSKPLIEFLESIGEDTTKQISQYDVADVVNKYVHDNNLLHPSKKKRIVCDEKLHSVFGKKTISRIKIYEMLEAHYAENQDESDFGFLFGSDEENGVTPQKSLSLEKKKPLMQKVPEKPKSCFAAIVPENIKMVYLKKSLVQDLLKHFENFEAKVVGSFVRIKSDPYDYLQKNSHMLVQVTDKSGSWLDATCQECLQAFESDPQFLVPRLCRSCMLIWLKKTSGTDGMNTDILLQVSNCVKDIGVSMLSDDDFKLEECVDLQQRVKSSLLKRPTVVELQEKAQILHEDIIKHWLPREIALLQRLIDRANEKGWRKEYPFKTLISY